MGAGAKERRFAPLRFLDKFVQILDNKHFSASHTEGGLIAGIGFMDPGVKLQRLG